MNTNVALPSNLKIVRVHTLSPLLAIDNRDDDKRNNQFPPKHAFMYINSAMTSQSDKLIEQSKIDRYA